MRIPYSVVTIRPYLQGGAPTSVWTLADLVWLFDRDHEFGFPRYWREVSGGLVDLDVQVEPFFDVQVSEASLAILTAAGGRAGAVQEVSRLLKDAGRRLGDIDNLAVFIGGYQADSGAKRDTVDGRWRSFMYADMIATHAFYAHEIGHSVGFEHPYDLRTPTGPKYQEYGDNADVMGATGDCCFPAPAADRGVLPGTELWRLCGPGASPASLWRYRGGYPAVPAWVRELPEGSPPVRCEIWRAGAPLDPAPAGHQLVVQKGVDPAKWYAVHYKSKQAWDQSIYPMFGAVTGVVQVYKMQSVRWPDVGVVPGRTEVEPPCLVAELAMFGGIPPPTWSDGVISVRLEKLEDFRAFVWVGRQGRPSPSCSLHVEIDEVAYQTDRTGETVVKSKTGPHCAKKTYFVVLRRVNVTVKVTVLPRGFVDPLWRFEVNGVQTREWLWGSAGVITGKNWGFVTFPARVRQPISLRESREVEILRTASWTLVGRTLTLFVSQDSGADEEGSYDLVVKAFVKEKSASDDTATTTEDTTHVVTKEIVLPNEVITEQAECIVSQLEFARLDPRWIDKLEEPEWQIPIEFPDFLRKGDFVTSGPDLVRLLTEETRGSAEMTRRLEEAAVILDVTPDVLRHVALTFARQR